jgi:FkbM family methyltransferase
MLPRVDLVRADECEWLLLNSPDQITEYIRKNGAWGITEASIAKVFLGNQIGANVIDVGSNIGGFSLPIAKHIANNKGAVYAFEPQRIVFQQFCGNVFLNRLDNIYAYNLALGDRACNIVIPELNFWESHNIGNFSVDASIRKNIANDAKSSGELTNQESGANHLAEQRTLDSFNFKFNINLFKVDIEGYELEFFKGASETIQSNNFPPIIFELWENRSWYEKKAEQTKAILHNWGYEFEQFGREILAQHPSHNVQCKVTREGHNINLTIV